MLSICPLTRQPNKNHLPAIYSYFENHILFPSGFLVKYNKMDNPLAVTSAFWMNSWKATTMNGAINAYMRPFTLVHICITLQQYCFESGWEKNDHRTQFGQQPSIKSPESCLFFCMDARQESWIKSNSWSCFQFNLATMAAVKCTFNVRGSRKWTGDKMLE